MTDQNRANSGICLQCGNRDLSVDVSVCPSCGHSLDTIAGFQNSDEGLVEEASRLIDERRKAGLEGLVGGLEYVVVNTEPEHQQAAVNEFLSRTSLDVADAFEDANSQTVVLQTPGSADVLVTSRRRPSPFARFTDYPKSQHLPATRLETFAFSCPDVIRLSEIQQQRGVRFLTDSPVAGCQAQWIQTTPSSYTGLSVGWIERTGAERSYRCSDSRDLNWRFTKPDLPFLSHVGRLDHTATRVRAMERDAAILEFMALTNYTFDFAIYVKSLNSITNVARLSADDFAMVFTSGIAAYVDDATSGPTERFINNYGPRTHHMAWETEAIDEVFNGLVEQGQDFLLDLIGSPDEGLKQTFSAMSSHTLLVNEYIHRFGDFDGFFTKSNVTLLTLATGTQ